MATASGTDSSENRGPPARSGVESPELVPDGKMARNGVVTSDEDDDDLLFETTKAAEDKLSAKQGSHGQKQTFNERQLNAKA